MKSRLIPSAALDFESAEARSLAWLPLAVRYKLDRASLHLTLHAWQALSIDKREALVISVSEDEFRGAAIQCGATHRISVAFDNLDMDLVSEAFGCDADGAARWLEESTGFSRYVLRKRMAQRCH